MGSFKYRTCIVGMHTLYEFRKKNMKGVPYRPVLLLLSFAATASSAEGYYAAVDDVGAAERLSGPTHNPGTQHRRRIQEQLQLLPVDGRGLEDAPLEDEGVSDMDLNQIIEEFRNKHLEANHETGQQQDASIQSEEETTTVAEAPSTEPLDSDSVSIMPSDAPSLMPSFAPTSRPSSSAPPSAAPTSAPSKVPSMATSTSPPTELSTTSEPTISPTRSPSLSPTGAPTTATPTQAPTTREPTAVPTQAPTTEEPTAVPTQTPTTEEPTAAPTRAPTKDEPTTTPTTAVPIPSASDSVVTSEPTTLVLSSAAPSLSTEAVTTPGEEPDNTSTQIVEDVGMDQQYYDETFNERMVIIGASIAAGVVALSLLYVYVNRPKRERNGDGHVGSTIYYGYSMDEQQMMSEAASPRSFCSVESGRLPVNPHALSREEYYDRQRYWSPSSNTDLTM